MDNDSLKAISRQDPSAVRQLVHHYQDYVFTIVLRIAKQSELAEEITQDVFLKVISKIDTFNGKSKFSTWLYTIAYRTALNACKSHPKIFSEAAETTPDITDESVDQDEIWERQRILWQGIDRLNTQQGVVLSLFYLQQFKLNEIAEIMSIPLNTVKSLLFRARRDLKTILLVEYKTEDLI